MIATIRIVDLRLRTLIGTHPWERRNKQELILNISLQYDASKAGRSDKLKDALDYEQITKIVSQTVERSRCQLLEKLAARIMNQLKSFKSLQSVSLQIDKPQAIAEAKCISYRVSA